MTAISSAPAAPKSKLRLGRESLLQPSSPRPTSYIPSICWWANRRRRGRTALPVDPLSVAHLLQLGFKKETARNALLYARNDVALAIELAIHDSHPLEQNPDCPVCQGKLENAAMRQWFKDQDLRPRRTLPQIIISPLSSFLSSTLSFGTPFSSTALASGRATDSHASDSTPLSATTPRARTFQGSSSMYTGDGRGSDEVASRGSSTGHPGAEPDRGEEDGETSVMPMTPATTNDRSISPHPHTVYDARLDGGDPGYGSVPISVPLNRNQSSATSNYSGSSGYPMSPEPKRSRDNISYRTHSRVQSTSSFYGWYHSPNGPKGGGDSEYGTDREAAASSPARARSDSIGRAL